MCERTSFTREQLKTLVSLDLALKNLPTFNKGVECQSEMNLRI